jgi:hypothetical protein
MTTFDFINSCLVYDDKLFEVLMYQHSNSTLLTLLKSIVLNSLKMPWRGNQLAIVSKVLLMLELISLKS